MSSTHASSGDIKFGEERLAAFWLHLDYFEDNQPCMVYSSSGQSGMWNREGNLELLNIGDDDRDKLICLPEMGRGTLALRTKLNLREVVSQQQVRTQGPIAIELKNERSIPMIIERLGAYPNADFGLVGTMSISLQWKGVGKDKPLKGRLYSVRIHALEMLELNYANAHFGHWCPVNLDAGYDSTPDQFGRPIVMADVEIVSTTPAH